MLGRSLALMISLTVACSDPTPASEPFTADEPAPEATRPGPPEPRELVAPSEPPPLPEARRITFEAEDGLTLVGDLRAGAGPEAPLVVLVHQLSTTRAEWEPLLRRFAVAPAMTTFALDMRGHGESTRRGDDTVAWGDFETADWERVAEDVRAALTHLREEVGLDPSHVILIGSSIGSSAVIRAAANEPAVDAVVALSPGRAYRGVDALTPLAALGERPLLAIASRGEPASAETATQMAQIAAAGDHLLVDGDRHGVGMFESAPEILDRVVAFARVRGTP